MPPELITSAQNPKVKRLLALQKDSSLRRESGLFVVEGQRELEHCMAAGFEPDTVFVCPDLYSPAPCDLCSGTVAARDRVNGRGPRAKRSGRDERSEVPGHSVPGYRAVEVRTDEDGIGLEPGRHAMLQLPPTFHHKQTALAPQ